MADAFETILVAWLAFAFLPERPTRSQGGTDGSNPLSSSAESRELRSRETDEGLGYDRIGQRGDRMDVAIGPIGPGA
jgi:hypothetical protein